MSRKVTVDLTIKLGLDLDEGIEVSEAVNELDYQIFVPPGEDRFSIVDMEITGHEVKDSRCVEIPKTPK